MHFGADARLVLVVERLRLLLGGGDLVQDLVLVEEVGQLLPALRGPLGLDPFHPFREARVAV